MNDIKAVIDSVDELSSWLEETYIGFHQDPELSMLESDTTKRISALLSEWGFEVQKIGGGVVGTLVNGEGPVVLHRADIDALGVKEESGREYASTKTMPNRDGETVPVMHACGHDVHITTGLAAARLLAEHKDAWHGTYHALFQPGEETAEGAKSMVDDGIAEKIAKPDVCFGQHVLTAPDAGQVAVTSKPAFSTALSLKITLHGVGSHGSMPHLGVDPILMGSAIVQRLQGIVARELQPGTFGVVTVGSFRAGNVANIIPETAVLQLNVRAYDDKVRDQIVAAIKRIVAAECEASNAPKPADIEEFSYYPQLLNDADVVETLRGFFQEGLGKENVVEMIPNTASEDFSFIPDAFGAPYCYWTLGGFNEGTPKFANHNPKFSPDMHPTLETGTKASLIASLGWFNK